MNATSLDERIERWQQNLLDLTLRNRLLKFKAGAAVRVLAPRPPRIFDMVVSNGSTLTVRELSAAMARGEVAIMDKMAIVAHSPAGTLLEALADLEARDAVEGAHVQL